MVWPFRNEVKRSQQESSSIVGGKKATEEELALTGNSMNKQEEEESDEFVGKYKHAPQRRDEEQPMDLGDLQDIFSFSFMKGRTIWNFFLAILWSIGLPILLYHILKPYIGQVLAMITASAPPLAIVIIRMVKDSTFDPLGCVAGVSFLISGILSIAEPDEKVSAICEGLVPLFIGVCCMISVIPIKIGKYEFKPLVFQFTNQVMPRNEEEELQKQDDYRLTNIQKGEQGRKKLDYFYDNMAKFRHDMRFMTVTWGALLILAFIIKVVIVMTSTDIWKAQVYGYILFGLTTFFMMIFTWFYTKIVKGHIISQITFWKEEQEYKPLDKRTETVQNVNWGIHSMSNAFGQVAG
ncbi:uncharacterized protein BX663DRAFT_521533 [Cokeromyces recurvatus]|uniref:uncharacterized protein n=1 Tax=Cokeromyces recurvatus TaxID=90255 RepID=UPI00221EBC3C|nr:uncharacterized protein BX663DRAFT_521533 [Cokeromyces recurvatus]KAI7899374.1 hypothetical protein BX663DRAFT_521533 [Cokeromyces recurvatus]